MCKCNTYIEQNGQMAFQYTHTGISNVAYNTYMTKITYIPKYIKVTDN